MHLVHHSPTHRAWRTVTLDVLGCLIVGIVLWALLAAIGTPTGTAALIAYVVTVGVALGLMLYEDRDSET